MWGNYGRLICSVEMDGMRPPLSQPILVVVSDAWVYLTMSEMHSAQVRQAPNNPDASDDERAHDYPAGTCVISSTV